jgi:hypothetical protein
MQILKRITSISASGRKKKDHISALECDGVEVIGDESLIKHITQFTRIFFLMLL